MWGGPLTVATKTAMKHLEKTLKNARGLSKNDNTFPKETRDKYTEMHHAPEWKGELLL